ncbi:hypothetical protein nbrc107696_21770 [Gordonia spumicola]|uniref:Uncharacterized protein n=1 Tax=Gordonia spumicola TaxID=589161 RepID=A0A7I9V9G2_9ACTN|nr:type IV toxin-antitoxin system AbiEi family antitoxin domain-containing protein [Gordonia spumicola]GEE01731.1 hypothetical protein nbrc107696_21770 [Gordonia spumicola]
MNLRLADVLSAQDGIIARRQALECGCTPNDIRRFIRRREWAVVFPGVYINHTGPLTWRQRAWAAVVDAFPAALGHTSALPGSTGPIHIVIALHRTVAKRPGVIVHQRSGLDDAVAWNLSPPRLRIEEAALDVAAAARTETDAIAVLADIVNARVTTAQRLIATLDQRARVTRRRLIRDVLVDIDEGTCSVLEHRYLTDVERPHGLPTPIRQAPTTVGRKGYRDLDYPDAGVVVELDGWRFHDSARDRDANLERDLDAAVGAQRLTLRLGSGQVIGRSCSTAAKVGRALSDRGWSGPLLRCPKCG